MPVACNPPQTPRSLTTKNRPLSRRDWIVNLAVIAFVALNFYLWSLPISQRELFLMVVPLGLAAFAAFMRFAPRN
jgi:hypothetical protein